MGDLTDAQKQKYAEGAMDDAFKIKRKYDKKREAIDTRIEEIDDKLKELNNGNQNTSTFTSGTVSTAFQLHSGRSDAAPKIEELKKERKELVAERDNLKAEEDAEIKQAVQDNVKKASGKTISEEDSEALSDDLQESEQFKEMHVDRSIVHDEVENVQELTLAVTNELEDSREFKSKAKQTLGTNSEVSIETEEDIDDEMAALLAAMGMRGEELLSETTETLDASMRTKAN